MGEDRTGQTYGDENAQILDSSITVALHLPVQCHLINVRHGRLSHCHWSYLVIRISASRCISRVDSMQYPWHQLHSFSCNVCLLDGSQSKGHYCDARECTYGLQFICVSCVRHLGVFSSVRDQCEYMTGTSYGLETEALDSLSNL
jgi:hypothetical protein